MKLQKFLGFIVFACFFVCAADAQQGTASQNNNNNKSGGNQATGTGTATSDSSSSVTLVQGNSGSGDRVEALPGPAIGGPVAGPAFVSSEWTLVVNPLFKSFSVVDMKAMQEPKGKIECHRLAAPSALPPKNDDPIRLVQYDPEVSRTPDIYPHDSVLGICTVVGDYRPGDELYYQALAKHAKRAVPGATRVALYSRHLKKTVSKESMFGFGIAGSSDSHPLGASGGYGHGSSSTMVQDPPQVELLILNNDGLIDLPTSPKQESKDKPETQMPAPTVIEKQSEGKTAQAPSSTQEPVNESPATSHDAPVVPPQNEATVDSCAYLATLHFSLKWAIDRPKKGDSIPGKPYAPKVSDFWTDPADYHLGAKSLDDWLAEIKTAADLIKNHPGCRVQVVGHASAEASDTYNVLLGDRRGWAIDYLLRQNGLTTEQLKQWVSLGKRQLVQGSEYNSNSRYVDLEAVGSETGP